MNFTIWNKKPLPEKYVVDLIMAFSSASTVTIGIGRARSFDNTFDIINAALHTADITASGVGGIDTGVEAADTWYALHIIDDSTGVNTEAAMLSLSETAPTLPGGYDKFRRVGWIRNDGGSNIIPFIQSGSSNSRGIFYDEDLIPLQVLSGGAAIVWTAIDLSDFVSPSSVKPWLHFGFTPSAIGDFVNIRPTGAVLTDPGLKIGPSGKGLGQGTARPPCNTSQSIEYEASIIGTLLDVSIVGYDESI